MSALRPQAILAVERNAAWGAGDGTVGRALRLFSFHDPIGYLVNRSDFDLARPRHGIRAALNLGEGVVHVLDFA